MAPFFAEARQTLVPHDEMKHGPLSPLLVAMTLVTGLIDAFSYLALNHVFVANMTGNVVFLPFALTDVSGFSIAATLIALGSFSLGALGGGLLGSRLGQHRGHLLSAAAAIQAFFLGVAVLLATLSAKPVPVGNSYSLIIILGIAMGIQNAVARRLAVPDLTTTVLTLTVVGIAADSRIVGGSGSKAGRRLISVAAMFMGALVGSLLIFHLSIVSPLVVAFILSASIAVAAWVLSRADPAWVRAS